MANKSKENTTGVITPESVYCRKCMKTLSPDNFYDAVDLGKIDSNGKFSVCKQCIQNIYDEIFLETQSMEKTIHKMCIMLNLKFSNDAIKATNAHINTLMEKGKNVNAIFSIYKMKVLATSRSMDKTVQSYDGYEDVGTIFVDKPVDTKIIPIPQDVMDFWGNDMDREDVEFLENEYKNFKNTHSTETYAEIVLLKQVCYTMLSIKKLRKNNDDTSDAVKELQTLMKNLAISPNATASSSGGKGADAFGMWIADIEKEEPAQWLKTDPRGDIFRDVGNVEEYFQKYFVRPLKNFILQSKDFNIDTESDGEDLFDAIDDGDL